VDEPVVTATSLSVLVARREEHQTLLVALARLPEEAQTVIVLYYWEGMVAREIAYVLGVSVSTITTQLSRARHALETQLRRIARARVNETVSADLERWVRSLADPKAVEAIGPRLPRLTPRIWKG
jgi:RNA polymerase sigma-70 factor (ECF subfamily)